MATTMSTLYIVATPIGNLDDLTIRAARVLGEVPVVVAEDSRVTRKILAHIRANPKVVAFHRRSSQTVVHRVMNYLADGDVALVSDAGTPGVNDPGQTIVAAAIELGHKVVPVPWNIIDRGRLISKRVLRRPVRILRISSGIWQEASSIAYCDRSRTFCRRVF